MAALQTAARQGVGQTQWVRLNPSQTPFQASVHVGLGGGTASVTLEATLDETDPTALGYVAPVTFPLPGSAAATADALVLLQQPVAAIRAVVGSGTATVTLRVLQAGLG